MHERFGAMCQCGSANTKRGVHLTATTPWRATPPWRAGTRPYPRRVLLPNIPTQQPRLIKMLANLQKAQNILQDLNQRKFRSIRQAARAYNIGKSTVAHRLQGRKPRALSYNS
jgi:hypothetical protein